MTDVVVTGFRELEAALKGLPPKLQKRALRPSTRAAARVVALEVKARAPVLTGAIRRNVIAKAGRDQGRTVARMLVGVRHGKASTRPQRGRNGKVKRLSAYARRGVDPFYFRFQERGFHAVGRLPTNRAAGTWARARRRDRVKRSRFVPGRFFMREGFRASSSRALEAMRLRLTAEIARLA